MGPAALWRCRGRKVGRAPSGARLAAWEEARALERQDSGLRGGARPSEGRRVSNAGAARAEPADTCGRRAGARRTGSPGARGTVAARACLPAHVGVIFKWNVVLAARLSGGRVGPPALAGGTRQARATASPGSVHRPARLSPLRASSAAAGAGRGA